MAEKDIAEKLLEDYNDVFADIVNVLLFGGKNIIRKEDLEKTERISHYKADDSKLHEQERDIAKYWKRNGTRIALCGLENQTGIDKDMCLRIINYDGVAYRSQLLDSASKERYPVVTIILYFGFCHWSGPRALHNTLNIPEELIEYTNDYKLHVFEIAYLTDEQVSQFSSDFRIIADYFVQMRKGKNYQPSRQIIKHVDELLKFMAVITNDNRFAEASSKVKKGGTTMCEVLDRIEQQGFEKGVEEGDAKRLVKSVEGAMRIFKASLTLACESTGATIDEYYQAKKVLEKI